MIQRIKNLCVSLCFTSVSSVFKEKTTIEPFNNRTILCLPLCFSSASSVFKETTTIKQFNNRTILCLPLCYFTVYAYG